MPIFENLLLIIISMFLIVIAWEDFKTFRIRNRNIAVLIVMYLILEAFDQFSGFKGDLAAAILLFSVGFVFWTFGLMGAGDVKIYLVVGLLTGWADMLYFVFWLMIFSLILMAFIVSPLPQAIQSTSFGRRLKEIKSKRNAPYGVAIAFAMIAVLLSRISFI